MAMIKFNRAIDLQIQIAQMAVLEYIQRPTLVSWILEHIEIREHLTKFAEKLIVEHLFYTISIATRNCRSVIY